MCRGAAEETGAVGDEGVKAYFISEPTCVPKIKLYFVRSVWSLKGACISKKKRKVRQHYTKHQHHQSVS